MEWLCTVLIQLSQKYIPQISLLYAILSLTLPQEASACICETPQMSVSSSHIYILEIGARPSTAAPRAHFCWYTGSRWWWRAVARLVVPPTPARLLLWHLPMLSQVYKSVSSSHKPSVWPKSATLKDWHRSSFVFMGSGLPVYLLLFTLFLSLPLHVCLSFPI